METELKKQRIVGLIVIVIAAIILLPLLLNRHQENRTSTKHLSFNIPQAPPHPKIVMTPVQQTGQAPQTVSYQKQLPTLPSEASTKKNVTSSNVSASKTAPEQTLALPQITKSWSVQLASFTYKKNAERLNKRLAQQGFHTYIQRKKVKNRLLWQIMLGPEIQKTTANQLKKTLNKKLHLRGVVVPYHELG